ncbi:hypothetical protein SH661x_002821 [Planctomicrobium sp. SH661]|uniref:hypothetical protein n=1 Tax=Planctomicrobium sp. SH661 TaxID=3448124 RepID=UPI003F5BA31E
MKKSASLTHTRNPLPASGPIDMSIAGNQIGAPLFHRVAVIYSQLASRITWHSHEQFEILLLAEGATSYEFSDGQISDLPGGHFLNRTSTSSE